MAAEKVDLRDVNFRQLFPWTEIFRGFQVALDPKKLLLAAAGILVMGLGWWLLAVIFFSTSSPRPKLYSGDYGYPLPGSAEDKARAESTAEENADLLPKWNRFKADRHKWNLLYETAGNPDKPEFVDEFDLADSPNKLAEAKEKLNASGPVPLPVGRLRTLPWFEDRGPNPYLLVTGQAARWDRGHFWDWVLTTQVPVLVEPLVKFFQPVIYLLRSNAGFVNRLYFLLVVLWTVATWALFGGAITRMAAVQIARREKISMSEAVRFTLARYLHYFSAPLFPLVFVLVVVLFLILFGFFHLIGGVGDILVDGLGWPLVLLGGLVMAVVLVGLVGWPMMYATISAEGSDNFDALSRSYSYVYQSPWQYIGYSLVALAYGMVVVFFIGFMGSLMVYLGKWGVSQTPGTTVSWINREPEYLFLYAPTSFGWRDLLVHGSPHVDARGQFTADYLSTMKWYNYAGAIMVALWLYLIFLMIVGFAYSYFWSASTIIYLLMRRKVDDTELDEVYLEDDDVEEAYPPPGAAPAGGAPITMLEPPTLKTASAPSASVPSARVERPPDKGDGNPPPAGPAV